MSKPEQFDIDITQGEDFELELTFDEDGVPFDITAYEFWGQLRSTASSPDKLADFDFAVVAGTNNKLIVRLVDTVTAPLPAGRIVFDFWQRDTNNLDSPIGGGVANIYARVTRP